MNTSKNVSTSNTSIVASALMQKLMSYNQTDNISETTSRNMSQIRRKKIKTQDQFGLQTASFAFKTKMQTNIKLNLQYEAIDEYQGNHKKIRRLVTSNNPKRIENIQVHSYNRNKECEMNKILKEFKITKPLQTLNLVSKKTKSYRNQISPKKKVSNFSLFFPKQKIKSYSCKNKRSVNLSNIDYNFSNPTRNKNTSDHQQLDLQQIGKLSSQKYIIKIQKFKKYKTDKINKQLRFGLNVLPVQYKDKQAKLSQKNKLSSLDELQSLIKMSKKKILSSTLLQQDFLQIKKQDFLQIKKQDFSQIKKQDFSYIKKQEFSQVKNRDVKAAKKSQSFKQISSKSHIKSNEIFRKNNSKFVPNQNEQINSVKRKVINMFNCLDQILNSFCCTINHNKIHQEVSNNLQDNITIQVSMNTPKIKRQKYYFFVANGNNRNLIRSIMKKRFWWTQVDNIQSAHFVWSQIKIKDILQKQETIYHKNIQQPDSWNFKETQEQTSPNDTKNLKKKHSQQLDQERSYYKKIFHSKMKAVYHKKLSEKNVQLKNLRHLSIPNLMHNHFDANYMLGNKKALYFNLSEYSCYKNLSLQRFIPQTFHIQNINSGQFRKFTKICSKQKNSIWIIKPGENTNRGNGIFVEVNFQKIKAHVQKNCQKHSFIVQKYVKNIFLYNRRKFDIRVYMLMATIGGITKFFWYEQGYLRTSSEIYNSNDLSDIFIHLTNDAIQVKNQTYSKYEKGNKISFSQFQRYLDLSYPNEKYQVKQLAQKMKQITEIVVKSTYSKLDKAKKTNGFQLFGLDFLIDSSFQPWLLQVNTNPCLQLSSPVLQRLIPRMIQNMFRLTLDPIFRPDINVSKHYSYFLYDNVFEKNKFTLIFDSLFDSDFAWQQICSKQKTITYMDDNQIFDDNGEQLLLND